MLLLLCVLAPQLQAQQWTTNSGYRSRDLAVPTNGQTGFTLLAPAQTGVTFSNVLSDTSAARNRILENGSGVALGDVDGDGWCDIYFCRLEGPNVLYRNLGNWKFVDITARAGVGCDGQYSTGAVFADVDGDGDLDLLVNSIGGGTRLFFNDGHGQFKEQKNSGLNRTSGSTSLALADFDGDGDLDLYVTNYRTTTAK
ncbi:MAG TPA: FG-GAP-like repeat-containing protein, partial [Candidatus Dormibacteraeota bacterium]|nr:FG-GAP-like repeat-containing protein [Candidatus Dormibacteraeota bacterium]